MLKYYLGVSLLMVGSHLYGQGYFQQDVNYDIVVELIDSTHTLQGTITIDYKNNSRTPLDTIYMHLWANAFKNRSTAFVKQKLRNFDTDFYYADESDYGGYSDLEFRVDGQQVRWGVDDEHIDIAYLFLNKPLLPGEGLTISTPFTLQIPASFSRLGHVETSYQMTQWYPKPAVFDHAGWHVMPYLDMGEFYSEFGDFKVEITLPENYYVGATGVLMTASERKFLEERMDYTDLYLKDSLKSHTEFPPSSKKKKTIVYEAESVHDFAWFADKRFLIQKEIARLSTGEEVNCWAFFTDFESSLWENAAFYTKRAIEFYSDRVGPYPYPQATAVQSALSAGGGMEYPMVTVIGPSAIPAALDQVITHEVGHNWFYGILASDERDHPWMDEGMNSYHDHKYMDIYYDDFDELGGILPAKIKRQMEYSALSLVYQVWSRIAKDQAPNTTSNQLTSVNYFLGAYEKPAIAFRILERYLGEEEFVYAMRDYYNRWKFKHPQPEDVKASFEQSTGKDLTWLFEGMLYSNAIYDYELEEVNHSTNAVTVINHGEVAAPVSITLYSDSTDATTIWFEGFLGSKTLTIDQLDGKQVEIDRERISLDVSPDNNDLRVGSLQLRFLSGLKTSKTNKIFYAPVVGINTSNLLQVGLAFHNYGIPLSNFQYYINPSVGIRKGKLIGSFEFRRDFPRRNGPLRNVSIALGGKSYHESYNERFDYSLRFTRIQPSIDFEWKKSWVSQVSHYLSYRPIGIITEIPMFSTENGYEGKTNSFALIHDLQYTYVKRSPITPLKFQVNTEFRRYDRGISMNRYLKLYGDVEAKFAYKKDRFFEIRGFAGFFPLHSERQISTSAALGNFSLFHRGVNDYRYDFHFIDRRGQDGFLSRQVTLSDGGFKNGITNSMPIGLSNNYMASVNLAIDLPFGWTSIIPIKPYFDAGLYSFKPTSSDPFSQELLYSAGLMIDFRKVVMIHFPFFNSDRINDVYAQTTTNYLQKISFTLNINKLDPHRLKYWFYR
ncbi:M1 family metallopeptidase [Portibacter marinus]|uniref:M1 family metallopeptidase n=1 Tax=Portibacter marinus TaxID=2898660 RepID=UPI001F425C84|nr:M1 family metallopeptidase [Portibacter marinus]